MNIQFADLCKLQREILKPLSPNQEFALVQLLVDEDCADEVAGIIEVMLKEHDHTERLYSAWLESSKHTNVVPLIVPVIDSENIMRDILNRDNSTLGLADSLRHVLDEAHSRMLRTAESQTELLSVSTTGPALTVDYVVGCMLDALNESLMPIAVRPTQEQRASRKENLLSFSKLKALDLFSGTLDYSRALRPTPEHRQERMQIAASIAHSAGKSNEDYSFVFER